MWCNSTTCRRNDAIVESSDVDSGEWRVFMFVFKKKKKRKKKMNDDFLSFLSTSRQNLDVRESP